MYGLTAVPVVLLITLNANASASSRDAKNCVTRFFTRLEPCG